jgi:tRNA 2-thiouridine synthesizing protein A
MEIDSTLCNSKVAILSVRTLDATGLKCPQPLMKMALLSADMKHGDILEVTADCPTFETDVRAWCARLKRTLLLVNSEGGYRKTVQIRF